MLSNYFIADKKIGVPEYIAREIGLYNAALYSVLINAYDEANKLFQVFDNKILIQERYLLIHTGLDSSQIQDGLCKLQKGEFILILPSYIDSTYLIEFNTLIIEHIREYCSHREPQFDSSEKEQFFYPHRSRNRYCKTTKKLLDEFKNNIKFKCNPLVVLSLCNKIITSTEKTIGHSLLNDETFNKTFDELYYKNIDNILTEEMFCNAIETACNNAVEDYVIELQQTTCND